jgi:hypothetical protein
VCWSPRWSAWFEGLQVSSEQAGQTIIAGPVTDQPALHGLLAKVRDLGLPLLWVCRIDPGATEALVIHAGSPLVAGAGPAAQCCG